MIFIKKHKEMMVSVLCASIPLIALLFPGIRHYIIGNYAVSAVYNTAIITTYSIGCFLLFFSFIELTRCNTILKLKDYTRPAYLLGDANKIVFSPEHGQNDDTLASLYESMKESVIRKQHHRLAAVQTCANISTMLGLLGTFAGLSITIASVISLLERSQISSNTNDADMLSIIVNVVSSLAEPLKGMNTAFVSSIYGVVSAILLGIMCSFLRSAYNSLSVSLRDANLDFLREMKSKQSEGKTRILQIHTVVDELVRDLKKDLTEFHQSVLSNDAEKRHFMAQILTKMDERHVHREAFETQILADVQDACGKLIPVQEGITLANQQLVSHTHSLERLHTTDAEQSAALRLIYGAGNTLNEMQQQQNVALTQFEQLSVKAFSTTEAQLTGINDAQTEHQRASLSQHQLTQALVESHTETFPPLFAQVASVQQTLHKEIIILKNKDK